MTDILILDADSIAYKAAAANESRSIKTTHIEKGVVESWDNRTAFRAYIKDTSHTEDMYTIEDVQDPRHVSYGKSLIRDMIKGYCNKTKVSKYEIYISGEGNFRDSIPLPETHILSSGGRAAGRYKSNRDETIRPVQLKELRAYMVSDLGASTINGMEVDDMSAIRAYTGFKEGSRIIQVTEDKDALGCVGWLFNPAKDKEPRLINGFGELHREKSGVKGTGRLWLYFQSLYGDNVDNYHGCDLAKIILDKAGKKLQFGEVAAYNVLKDCKTDKEAWSALYGQYLSWYPEPTAYLAHDGEEYVKNALQIMDMYVECAHMRRWPDDKINCEAVLNKLGIV